MNIFVLYFIMLGLLILIDRYCIYKFNWENLYIIYYLLGPFFLISLILIIDGKKNGYEETYEKTLASLKINNETEGGFYIGTGYIDETEYYYFFYKDGKGYTRGKMITKEVLIIESDSIPPQIKTYGIKIKSRSGLVKWPNLPIKKYFYVPKGTILNQYKLN